MPVDEEEKIDLIDIFLTLWKHRTWITVITGVISIIGLLYALFAKPIFHSEIVFMPKESQKQSASSMLGQLGGFGGLVASQFGFSVNNNLDKIEIIAKGRELSERVITKHNFMGKLYPNLWNEELKKWDVSDTGKIPKLKEVVESIRNNILNVSQDAEKNIMVLGINIHDPVLAKDLTDCYFKELNLKIQNDIKTDAAVNINYLKNRLQNISDPLIREKIQNMMAFEIERSMLVAKRSFDVLEKPVIPLKRIKPKRKLIVLLFFCIGLFLSIAAVFFKIHIDNNKARFKEYLK